MIRRYESWPETTSTSTSKQGMMFEDAHGHWILYADHAAIVAEAVRALRLRKDAEAAWRSDCVRHDACHAMTLIAEEAAAKFLEAHLIAELDRSKEPLR